MYVSDHVLVCISEGQRSILNVFLVFHFISRVYHMLLYVLVHVPMHMSVHEDQRSKSGPLLSLSALDFETGPLIEPGTCPFS